VAEFTPATTALIVVDVQRGFDEIEAAGHRRNNPGAVAIIAGLLAHCRAVGVPVVHVRHASLEPESVFRAERPGFAAKDEARELPGEPVIVKHVNSAFIGTDLEHRLRAQDIDTLVITGATTNHCVETTTRMAGNLGFRTLLVRDATWTFDRAGPDGEDHRAEDIHQMTLANLSGEFAEIVTADTVRARLRSAREPAIG
jgi:nicotinamidase-related amidase